MTGERPGPVEPSPTQLVAGWGVPQPIVGFVLDEEGHWVALLACGHRQHVRHDPPLVTREWTRTVEGRASRLGQELRCLHCRQDPTA